MIAKFVFVIAIFAGALASPTWAQNKSAPPPLQLSEVLYEGRVETQTPRSESGLSEGSGHTGHDVAGFVMGPFFVERVEINGLLVADDGHGGRPPFRRVKAQTRRDGSQPRRHKT